MLRRVAQAAGATAVFAVGLGGGMLYMQTDPSATSTREEREATWQRLAASYDNKIGFTEDNNGITAMRQRLMRHARGSVLEASHPHTRHPHTIPHTDTHHPTPSHTLTHAHHHTPSHHPTPSHTHHHTPSHHPTPSPTLTHTL